MGTQPVLAVLAPLALVGTLAALFVLEIPPESRQITDVVLALLGAMCKDVYGFYFGSSLGSREKDAALRGSQKVLGGGDAGA